MILVRFRSGEDHKDILKKVKKMKMFAEELEECLEDVMEEDDEDYRYRSNYRREDEDYMNERRGGGRYSYRGRGRM